MEILAVATPIIFTVLFIAAMGWYTHLQNCQDY